LVTLDFGANADGADDEDGRAPVLSGAAWFGALAMRMVRVRARPSGPKLISMPILAGRSPPGAAARPDGEGPFPAVVVLHGCAGYFGTMPTLADRLKSWGYAALAVDSLGPRGIADQCGALFIEQAIDAYAPLNYLSRQPFVDPGRVAVLGFSMGGGSALGAPVDLTVYPGAHHGFNFPELQPGTRRLGHWLEYNEAAATDAEAKLRGFLAAHLAAPTADKPPVK
jgi:dienelactone hydrolase